MSRQNYRHTQVGYLTLTLLLVVAVAVVAFAPASARPITIGVASLIAIFAVLFSSLTVEVTSNELRFHFGLGFWRKQFALADIASANPTTSNWLEGWGIRITPRGMLYNVSGTDAVEIELRSGQRFRIGTDEPEALVQALQTPIGRPEASGRSR